MLKVNPPAGGQKPKVKNGFTMIELLIAMSLFLVLISVSVGGFIRSLQTQRTIIGLMEASDSISLVLEKMTREMRDGYGFTQASGSAIQFVNRYGQSVVYSLNGTAIERNGQKLTADNVNITNFFVKLSNIDYGEGSQPRITMGLSVSVNSKYLQNFSISIQTTVSPRMMILNSPN